jgi:hypothetical protein
MVTRFPLSFSKVSGALGSMSGTRASGGTIATDLVSYLLNLEPDLRYHFERQVVDRRDRARRRVSELEMPLIRCFLSYSICTLALKQSTISSTI